jgi:hypothetical protein
VKGVVRYFVKIGDTNITETNLFVARRKEISRRTNKQPLCFIDVCLMTNVTKCGWTPLV